MKKEIVNKNDNGEYHGYQEWLVTNDIWYRGVFKHGNEIGYNEVNWSGAFAVVGDKGTETKFRIR